MAELHVGVFGQVGLDLVPVVLVVADPLAVGTDGEDGAERADLGDRVAQVADERFAFFVGCYVIGSYWAAQHRFSSWLAAVDRGFVALTVVYLSFVALLPFPTGVLGEFADNPISVVAFAVNMGAVSTMEAVLFSHARRRRLFREEWPEDVYRWELRSSLSPVLLFALSIPVAFVLPQLGIVVWFLAIPFGMFLNRYRPKGAERYLT